MVEVEDPTDNIAVLAFKKDISLAGRWFYECVTWESIDSIAHLFTYCEKYSERVDDFKVRMRKDEKSGK